MNLVDLSQFIVFDHDSGRLLSLTKEIGFYPLVTTKFGDAKDEEAERILSSHKNWKIAFVHIRDKQWDSLCSNASDDQILVRFSTEGYSLVQHKGFAALSLNCKIKIDKLKKDDLKSLKDVLNDSDSCAGLREGIIPQSIRHLIAFQEPHRLCALHILIQGLLVIWASDSGHKKSLEARKCLGVSTISPIPNRITINLSTIRQALGLVDNNGALIDMNVNLFRIDIARELGIRAIADDKTINSLVNSICTVDLDDIKNNNDIIEGFKALDMLFKK
jgi:hypothetical protein